MTEEELDQCADEFYLGHDDRPFICQLPKDHTDWHCWSRDSWYGMKPVQVRWPRVLCETEVFLTEEKCNARTILNQPGEYSRTVFCSEPKGHPSAHVGYPLINEYVFDDPDLGMPLGTRVYWANTE